MSKDVIVYRDADGDLFEAFDEDAPDSLQKDFCNRHKHAERYVPASRLEQSVKAVAIAERRAEVVEEYATSRLCVGHRGHWSRERCVLCDLELSQSRLDAATTSQREWGAFRDSVSDALEQRGYRVSEHWGAPELIAAFDRLLGRLDQIRELVRGAPNGNRYVDRVWELVRESPAPSAPSEGEKPTAGTQVGPAYSDPTPRIDLLGVVAKLLLDESAGTPQERATRAVELMNRSIVVERQENKS